MTKATLAKLEAERQAKHRHLVVLGTVMISISVVLFTFEILGLAGAVGVTGTLLIGVADL